MKNKINKIIVKSNETANKLFQEEIVRDINDSFVLNNNKKATFNKRFRSLSTEWETMDVFEEVEGEGITAVYKDWEIDIYTTENLIDTDINYILPFIRCNVVYKYPKDDESNFYNTHEDIHQCYFHEVQDNLLILHVVVLINKPFDTEIIVPDAKVRVSLINPLIINT